MCICIIIHIIQLLNILVRMCVYILCNCVTYWYVCVSTYLWTYLWTYYNVCIYILTYVYMIINICMYVSMCKYVLACIMHVCVGMYVYDMTLISVYVCIHLMIRRDNSFDDLTVYLSILWDMQTSIELLEVLKCTPYCVYTFIYILYIYIHYVNFMTMWWCKELFWEIN